MRVLLLHNFYQQAGGEDAVLEAEAELLRGGGHEVRVETVTNDTIDGFGARLRALWQVADAPERADWLREMIASSHPDVVHVHNFFPLLTSAVHRAASQAGVAVVQTLHNYRLFCAAATFERGDEVCELCLTGSRWNAVRHRCYRGSLPGSTAVAYMQSAARRAGGLFHHVDKFIALTEFAKDKAIQGGIPAEKLSVKPNFLPQPDAVGGNKPRTGALFVGRLSHEKGLLALLDAWRQLPGIPLRIAGSGPLEETLRQAAPENVTFLGKLSAGSVAEEMHKARALIVPSLWYEGFPMTIVEAFACGLPVIASRLGSLGEIVEHGRNGLHFTAGDAVDLANTVRDAFEDPDGLGRMGMAAAEDHRERYSPATNLAQLESIYREAIAHRNSRM